MKDYGTGNAFETDVWPIMFIVIFGTIASWFEGMNIGLMSLMVGLLLWLANHYLARRNGRIERVVNEYVKIQESRSGQGVFVNGLDVLLRSGVTELNSRSEMVAVCHRITAKQLPHPNWANKDLPDSKLLGFLKFCQKHNHDIQDTIEASFTIALFNKELDDNDHKAGL